MADVVCAWCAQEGIRSVIKHEDGAATTEPESHGICPAHLRALQSTMSAAASSHGAAHASCGRSNRMAS